jgi:hypothetical protein
VVDRFRTGTKRVGEAMSGKTLVAGVSGFGRVCGNRRDASPAGSSLRPKVTSSAARAALALAVVLVAAGCASIQPPVLDPAVAALEDRPAVIFVSGLTGTALYDREARRVTWGDARSTFLPRDRGRAMARPIGGAEDRVETREPILDMSLRPFYRYEVYRPIVTTLEANGFERGRDLFLFGYDWRQSNVESARALARLIDDVGKGRPVVLICQSNGGYLCRWAVRAGDVSLDEAERGVARLPRARVEALVFLGTTHAGSIRILREIDRGRTYVPLGRFLGPETFFTFESLYQDLPPWRDDLFVAGNGDRIDVDLFDAASWERYGWSIFGAEAARQADRHEDLFGDRETRVAFLRRALENAQRFHAVLRDAPPPHDVRYYSIQNRSHRTIDRAMLVRDGAGWRTLFVGDRCVDTRPGLAGLMATPGDLHAGAEGQDALSPGEAAALAEPLIEVDGDHLGVVRSPASHRAILRIIASAGSRSPPR